MLRTFEKRKCIFRDSVLRLMIYFMNQCRGELILIDGIEEFKTKQAERKKVIERIKEKKRKNRKGEREREDDHFIKRHCEPAVAAVIGSKGVHPVGVLSSVVLTLQIGTPNVQKTLSFYYFISSVAEER